MKPRLRTVVVRAGAACIEGRLLPDDDVGGIKPVVDWLRDTRAAARANPVVPLPEVGDEVQPVATVERRREPGEFQEPVSGDENRHAVAVLAPLQLEVFAVVALAPGPVEEPMLVLSRPPSEFLGEAACRDLNFMPAARALNRKRSNRVSAILHVNVNAHIEHAPFDASKIRHHYYSILCIKKQ